MARRRSRELFPTDGPLGAAELIGRSEEVRDLTRTLAGGVNRIIAGPRRTGKTIPTGSAWLEYAPDGNVRAFSAPSPPCWDTGACQ